MTQQAGAVTLGPVTAVNWRAAADLEVRPDQERFVAPVTRYLTMCAYDDGPWQPFVVERDGRVVGFVMEGVDADGSAWVGGLVVDRDEQGRGVGRAVVEALAARARDAGRPNLALSYSPDNTVAKALYARLGFVETGETDDDEVVARLPLAAPVTAVSSAPAGGVR